MRPVSEHDKHERKEGVFCTDSSAFSGFLFIHPTFSEKCWKGRADARVAATGEPPKMTHCILDTYTGKGSPSYFILQKVALHKFDIKKTMRSAKQELHEAPLLVLALL